MTYSEAKAITDKKNPKKLCHNTWLEYNVANWCSLKLHKTYILVFYSDGKVLFKTGGFYTRTTKDRLNKYGPKQVHIWQKDFEWFVNDGIPFQDRMIYDTKENILIFPKA